MKKWIAVLLLLCMAVSLCACGNEPVDPTDGTTTAPSTTTQKPEESTGTAEPAYVVTIVDDMGSPVSGAIIQMCKLGDDGSCTPGNPSDAQGKVTFKLAKDSYKVSFIVMPAGYTYADENKEFYFDKDSMELTITLKKAG